MFVKVNEGKVVQYPYSVEQLKSDNPNTSFPIELSQDALKEWNVYPVFHSEEPNVAITETYSQGTPVFNETTKQWVQTWVVRNKTEEETKEYLDTLQRSIVDQTQAKLDAFAGTRGYGSILSACTYATSSVSKFKTEGQYCVDMRDATWAKLYQILEEVKAGMRPVPSEFKDVEPFLPVLRWPDEATSS